MKRVDLLKSKNYWLNTLEEMQRIGFDNKDIADVIADRITEATKLIMVETRNKLVTENIAQYKNSKKEAKRKKEGVLILSDLKEIEAMEEGFKRFAMNNSKKV